MVVRSDKPRGCRSVPQRGLCRLNTLGLAPHDNERKRIDSLGMSRMSPHEKESRNLQMADNDKVMQSLISRLWAKEQTLRQLQARLAEREQQASDVQHQLA